MFLFLRFSLKSISHVSFVLFVELVSISIFHFPIVHLFMFGVGLVITKGCVLIGFVIEPGGKIETIFRSNFI